jgi:hypothetical protein
VQALGGPYGAFQHVLEAIATVADCVPLVEENRHIVRRGLAALRIVDSPGIRALCAVANVLPSELTADDIGFRLAPRLNAAGRLGNADLAVELLAADNLDAANTCARTLQATNDRRREIERSIVDAAIEQVESWSDAQRAARVYVVSGADWHEGVVGIVASRLVDRYHRPIVVIGESGAVARGSGRSIDAFDLHGALAKCDDLLVRWGGHHAAAGLTIEPARIPELRARMTEIAAELLTPADLEPTDIVDAVLAGDELELALAEELEQLAPFGTGNPRPHFIAAAAAFASVDRVGTDQSHLRGRLSIGSRTVQSIGFGMGELLTEVEAGERFDATVRVSINRFRGSESLQLELVRLAAIPVGEDVDLGLCPTGCTLSCAERAPVNEVLDRAFDLALSPNIPSDDLPALEPVLAQSSTRDLRHQGRAGSHIVRLLTAGQTIAIVCGDVAARRRMLSTSLQPRRLGVRAVALASDRCSTVGIERRLKLVAKAEGPGLVLCDYESLDLVVAAVERLDTVVVLDPPGSETQRASLESCGLPVHLVFGAEEQRHIRELATVEQDVRSTMAGPWRAIRAAGGWMEGDALSRTLAIDGERLRSTRAVVSSIRELAGRGLMTREGSGLRIHERQPDTSN